MKLLVGLGNPGKKYEQTRHNVGFEVLALLARRHPGHAPRRAFQGELLETQFGSERVLLLTPHTLMNRSGASVREAVAFYKLPLVDLLIVCDDFNLPLGKLRVRAQGSAGGQRGLEDIIRVLGSPDVPRLRIGIGTPPAQWDAADFVLSRFRSDERSEIEIAFQRAADAAETWAAAGIQETMNRFNA